MKRLSRKEKMQNAVIDLINQMFIIAGHNEFEFKNFESKKNLELRLSNLEKDIDVIKNLLEVLINGKK